jgi:hypothetical protein
MSDDILYQLMEWYAYRREWTPAQYQSFLECLPYFNLDGKDDERYRQELQVLHADRALHRVDLRDFVDDREYRDGRTHLVLALETSNIAAVRALLKAGAVPTSLALETMVTEKSVDADVMAEVLQHADIQLLDMVDEDGDTLLIKSARCERTDAVQVLVKHGANLDLRDSDGSTALINAWQIRDEAICRMLIGAGARFPKKRQRDDLDLDSLGALDVTVLTHKTRRKRRKKFVEQEVIHITEAIGCAFVEIKLNWPSPISVLIAEYVCSPLLTQEAGGEGVLTAAVKNGESMARAFLPDFHA